MHTRRIVLSALFLSLALILRTFFRMYIPLMGESGMRLSIHGVFSIMPSLLFGPGYGAMVSGLTDFVGHFLSPSGAWIPWLTVTAVLGGATRGWLWIALKNKNAKAMRIVLASLGVLLIAFGTVSGLSLRGDGITRDFFTRTPQRRAAWEAATADAYGAYWHIHSTRTQHLTDDNTPYWRVREEIVAYWGLVPGQPIADWGALPHVLQGTRVIIERYGYNDAGEWGLRRSVYAPESYIADTLAFRSLGLISRAALTRSFATVGQTTQVGDFISMTTWAPLGAGLFFFLLLLLDVLVRRVLKDHPLPPMMALILTLMVPAIMVSVVNTYILSQTAFTAWQLLPFWVVALPRLLQSLATTTLNIFFVSLLLGLCEKQESLRALIRR